MKTTITKKVTVALTIMLLLIQPVFGQTAFGNFDCGQWVTSKNEPRKAWLLGFMTGMSLSTHFSNPSFGDWLGKANSADQMFVFVDNFCQKNPLNKIESAAVELYLELRKK